MSCRIIYGRNVTLGPVRKGKKDDIGRHNFANREVLGGMVFLCSAFIPLRIGRFNLISPALDPLEAAWSEGVFRV